MHPDLISLGRTGIGVSPWLYPSLTAQLRAGFISTPMAHAHWSFQSIRKGISRDGGAIATSGLSILMVTVWTALDQFTQSTSPAIRKRGLTR